MAHWGHAPSLTSPLDATEVEALPSHRVVLSQWSTVSGRRRRPVARAGLRPPLKPSVRISRAGLSQKCVKNYAAPKPVQCGRPVCLSSSLSCHVSSDTDFWVFHIGNLSTSVSLLTCQPFLLHHLCPSPSPAHIAAFVRSRRFHGASGTIRRSDYSSSIASHFAFRL